MRMIHSTLLATALLLLSSGGAWAACTSPDGTEGEMGYNFDEKTVQYCNGTEWISVATHIGKAKPEPVAGMVGYWDFESGSGTDLIDRTSNTLDGTLTNMDPSTDWILRNGGGALDFDGDNDHIVMSLPDAHLENANLTVAAWVNPRAALDSWANIVSKTTGNSTEGWSLERRSSSGSVNFWVNEWSTTYVTAPFTYGIWQHFVGTYDGNFIRIYKNGVLVNQAAQTDPLVHGDNEVHIGKHQNFANYMWNGGIDDVRIYDYALTEQEVLDLYLATGGVDACATAGSGDEGTVCADGTVYAGDHPVQNVRMFVTPADNSTGVTWNDGSSNWTSTGADSLADGAFNTALLDGLADAGAPYQAAELCAGLTANTKSDWYLPARNELNVLYSNEATIGGFDTGGEYYWSSTEDTDNLAFAQLFSDGTFTAGSKSAPFTAVRCVRKETCTNPDGVAGEMVYNADENIMQFCNGSHWVGIR